MIMLLIMGVMLLGAYEAFATYLDPAASIRSLLQASQGPNAEAAASGAVRWATIEGPAQTYWLDDREAWVAMPGERYRILKAEKGWLLVRWEGDSPDTVVWIEQQPWVHVAEE
jgi:hypothetical protein